MTMPKMVLVPTPLGHLGDMTFRAVETLKSARLVAAEDTRRTAILFKHYGISTPVVALHAHNEHRKLPEMLDRFGDGILAVVTDAGTPGVSDPGFLAVRHALERGWDVETLPGPTAFLPALVNSGLPMDRFCFEGFLPVKKGRQKRLQSLISETRTMIFYESPFRIVRTLKDLAGVLGAERKAAVARELTKIHEETRRGTLGELAKYYENGVAKGEFVLVAAGLGSSADDGVD
jgi:16S rRNA (cytidine1402-2'-O)-methyltransferase